MGSLGYNVPLHRTLAFGFAAFLAVARRGALRLVEPARSPRATSTCRRRSTCSIMAVIGGLVRIEGAWVGAFVFILMQNYITSSTHIPLLGFGGHAVRRELQHDDRDHLPGDRRRLARRAARALWGGSSTRGVRRGRRATAATPASRAREMSRRSTDRLESWVTTARESRTPSKHREGGGHYQMRRLKLRSWKTAAVLSSPRLRSRSWRPASLAASHAKAVKVAIMTDCKGAFAFGYESTSAAHRLRSRSSPTA